MACRVCALVFQVRKPDKALQAQEGAEGRAPFQQVRESQRMENFASQETLLQSRRKIRLIELFLPRLFYSIDLLIKNFFHLLLRFFFYYYNKVKLFFI